MDIRCDLHIHSALSPCADPDMTPANIVNMARLNGLELIAITDHQSCANLRAASELSRRLHGPLLLPGLEVTSAEEIHLLCFFPDITAAEGFSSLVREKMILQANRPDIFGSQLIFDQNDQIVAQEENLLLMPTRITAQDLARLALSHGGACLPAHVDRDSNSMLGTFGVIPEDFPLCWLEISARTSLESFYQAHPELRKYPIIRSSDAHHLGDIADPGWLLRLSGANSSENVVSMIISALRQSLIQ